MPSSWCVAEGINLHALQQREVNSKLSHRVGIEDGKPLKQKEKYRCAYNHRARHHRFLQVFTFLGRRCAEDFPCSEAAAI